MAVFGAAGKEPRVFFITIERNTTSQTVSVGVPKITVLDVLKKVGMTTSSREKMWLKRQGKNVYRDRPLSLSSELNEHVHNHATIVIAPKRPASTQAGTQPIQLPLPADIMPKPILPVAPAPLAGGAAGVPVPSSAPKKMRRVARAAQKRKQALERLMRVKIRARRQKQNKDT